MAPTVLWQESTVSSLQAHINDDGKAARQYGKVCAGRALLLRTHDLSARWRLKLRIGPCIQYTGIAAPQCW